MNLNNFHKHIPPAIYNRGEEYYENDMIDHIEHVHPDTWNAEVVGNDIYSVEIKLKGNDILSWACGCPYDHGDICKHVVAVLLHIKDSRSEFDLHSKKEAKPQVDYGKKMQKCFYELYYGHLVPRAGADIAWGLDFFIKEAESLIKRRCQEEALTILLHIIREIGNCYEECDDYDGELGSVCQAAAALIAEMIEMGLSDDLLKVLTDTVAFFVKNSNYDNYDLADLNQLLILIGSRTSNFDTAIYIVDETLKNEPDSFRTYSLIMSKIELLEKAGKKEEVEKVISFYLYIPEIRKIKLKELMSKKLYGDAHALIDEGINLAKEKEHAGIVSDWKDEKLSVYKLEDNKAKVIELAEDLFINGRDSMKYYYILKSIIPLEQWANYLDDLLYKSGKQEEWELDGSLLAKIYIAEEYWERLMVYVEKNIQLRKYDSLGEYEPYLKPRYPERMLAFYRSKIIEYAANNMGREHYKYVSEVLKKMKKYPCGTGIVNMLLTHFKSIYANRRAMMEELSYI